MGQGFFYSRKINYRMLMLIIVVLSLLCANGLFLFAAPLSLPATPVLSHDNSDEDGNYNITMRVWWGNNGTSWKLYENGVLVLEESLEDHSPNTQVATEAFRNKDKGTYLYKCELINTNGTSTSSEIVVNVNRSLKDKVQATPSLPANHSNINSSLNSPSDEQSVKEKRVVGYFPEWGIYEAHNNFTPSDIPWDKLTHVYYAFAKPEGGKVSVFDEWAATGVDFGDGAELSQRGCLGQFKILKAMHPDVKTIISLGGWTLSRDFHIIAISDISRTIFADSCVEFIRKYSFDGVDIGWNYPNYNRDPDIQDNPNDTGSVGGPEDKHNFTLLLQKIREKLDNAGSEDGKYYELSVAGSAGFDKIIYTEPDLYYRYIDALNVMTYDFHGNWDNFTGHQSQLYFNPDEAKSVGSDPEISKTYSADWAVSEYLRYGVPAHLITVGVPYYSRGWKGVESGNNTNLPGLFTKNSGATIGKWDGGVAAGINSLYDIQTLERNTAFIKYRDKNAGNMPYLYSESLKEMYTYEDVVSITTKCDYIIKNGLGGMMIWEITGDYPAKGDTLTDTIYDKLVKNKD